MPTATFARPGFATDRTGFVLCTTREGARHWIATGRDHGCAVQCWECGEVYDDADAGFDCCGQSVTIAVTSLVLDCDLYEAVRVDTLTLTTEGA